MLELYFAEPKDIKRFTCEGCSEINQKQRNCAAKGFNNVPPGREIKLNDSKFAFCPGKVSWYPEIINLYYKCDLAAETGILPDRGYLVDQESVFADVFADFVRMRAEKNYSRSVKDFSSVLIQIVEAIFGGKGKGASGSNKRHR